MGFIIIFILDLVVYIFSDVPLSVSSSSMLIVIPISNFLIFFPHDLVVPKINQPSIP